MEWGAEAWAWHCNQISGHCLEEATQSSPGPEIEIDETSMQFIDASSRMPPDMEGGRGGIWFAISGAIWCTA